MNLYALLGFFPDIRGEIYDSKIICEFTKSLYAKANLIVRSFIIMGIIIGLIIGYLLDKSYNQSGYTYSIVFALILAVIGYIIGDMIAFMLKLQAQLILCQVQIENNTSEILNLQNRFLSLMENGSLLKEKMVKKIQGPKDAEYWYDKALNLDELGKYKKAIKLYDKVLEIDPKHIKAWNNKGLILDEQNKYEKAILCYEKALKINPSDEEIWYNKGLSYQELGAYNESIECFDKVLELDPDSEDAKQSKEDALKMSQ